VRLRLTGFHVRRYLWALLIAVCLIVPGWVAVRAYRQAALDDALIRAVKTNNLVEVNAYLKGGANVNSRIGGHPSSADGIAGWLKWLAARKHRSGPTLLLSAVSDPMSDPSIAESLVKHGADVRSEDEWGNSALDLVLVNFAPGKAPLARVLLENGSSPVGKHVNALTMAMVIDDVDIARLALDRGASPNTPNVLVGAVNLGFDRFVELLLSRGADANLPSADGDRPLTVACRREMDTLQVFQMSKRVRLNIVKLLLKSGARPDLNDRAGRNAIDYAIARGDQNLLTILRQH